jgi:hypothetical protein
MLSSSSLYSCALNANIDSWAERKGTGGAVVLCKTSNVVSDYPETRLLVFAHFRTFLQISVFCYQTSDVTVAC